MIDNFFSTGGTTKKQSSSNKPANKKNIPETKAWLPKLRPATSDFDFALDATQHTDKPPNKGEIPVPSPKPGSLTGIRICASGTLPHFTRAEVRDLITACGGTLQAAIKDNVDIFLRGCLNVSQDKLNSALKKGISVIDEEGLLAMLAAVGCTNIEGFEAEKDQKHTEEVPQSKSKGQQEEVIKEVEGKRVQKPEVKQPKQQTLAFGGINFNDKKESSATNLISEKYRPQNRNDLIGNKDLIEKIDNWLITFSKQDKKAVLISGPPGIGKTSTALLLAKSRGYHVVEYNASDVRNKAAIEDIAKTLFNGKTLYSFTQQNTNNKQHAIIFDEIDGMSTGDRGGVQALAQFIEKSTFPIFCICNDRQSEKLKPILKYVLDIQFSAPDKKEMIQRVFEISKQEGIKIDRKNLFAAIDKSGGDMRSALNALQLWSSNCGNAHEKTADEYATMDGFEAAKKLCTEKDFEKRISLFMVDYYKCPDFIHDVLTFNGNMKQYADALDSMSDGDTVQTILNQDQNYDLLIPMGIIGCVTPPAVAPVKVTSNMRFPECYLRASKMNKNNRLMQEFTTRSARVLQSTPSTMRESTADILSAKMQNYIQDQNTQELKNLLELLEITPEDAENLKSIVSFQSKEKGKSASQDDKASQKFVTTFQKKFSKTHSKTSLSAASSQDERASYFISSQEMPKGKGKGRGKKKK
ncbi:differentiation specific element binding protein, putative [Trichomonas vaginalis G3]|uniref:Replication factor C subunit 1 n=1 Tax=Trichomonas vaginalis (strain ATCC PRA-98 / G3) TaxID=412133 RepID=A2E9V5_TRIV3|nr:DNA clamp loader protein [Trichomonas vaginalis G3]EAY10517.1 differentiation specific element binding protein, putative [Trichomonas vaginalis G3]KAI5551967.1 DNA clamp loader protein [Trichomonas vaginalis G3]|eukprot:XP_001322740.1 differentiation specific element binding protein [Trichomonas vaginalis G3]